MTVYVDEIFLANLLMDWLVLGLTRAMTGTGGTVWSLWPGALAGAVYGVLVLLPYGLWLTLLPARVGWSILMVWMAFGFDGWRRLGRRLACFYLCSFALGGSAMAAMSLFAQPLLPVWSGIGVVQMEQSWIWVAAGVALVLVIGGCIRQRLLDVPVCCSVQLWLNQRTIALSLLVDTGHSLTDPLTGHPVLIVEQQALLPLFDQKTQEQMRQWQCRADQLCLMLGQGPLAGRLRLIPCRTVGGQSMLLGFRPDRALIGEESRQVLVAIAEQQFSGRHPYQGLAPPQLL